MNRPIPGSFPGRRLDVRRALFGKASGAPYYIVAPRYVGTSAGITVLYRLCHLLNSLGEDAYIVPATGGESGALSKPDLRAPVLTQELADVHFKERPTPIVIYTETAKVDLGGGYVVRYVMNYPGLLDGPAELPGADEYLAYTARLARSLPTASQILYIPVSDPEFWTGDPTGHRDLKCVYAGKYVDFHGQSIPDEIAQDALLITRDKATSQSREELRDIFRRAAWLYVFENTALAVEAALCGCPVVFMRNPYFHEPLAHEELGVHGFADGNAPDALKHAQETVALFRTDYLAAVDKVGSGLLTFIARTQAGAKSKRLTGPTRLPTSPGVRAAERLSFHIRRLALSLEEIGAVETIRRGALGLLRRALGRRRG